MKNLLKSLFIGILPIYTLAMVALAIYQLTLEGFSLSWFGALISFLPVLFIFIKVFTVNTPRTSANLWAYTILIFSGLIISTIGNGLENFDYKIATILANITFFTWIIYVYWYSRFGKRNNDILKVGNILPQFTLEDTNKNKISSEDFKGKSSLYLFYRGNWCPLCMAQIKEISDKYKELNQRGVQIILVSPQPHTHTKSLAKRFDVPFNFLIDIGNKVTKQLDIFAKNGTPAGLQTLGYASDTVMPTVVITDINNKIIFADLTDNYRVRPEPETFLKILDENNSRQTT